MEPADNSGASVRTWTEAFDASEVGFLSSVWGSAPDDVYMVGGQPGQGVIYHFDGGDWSPVSIPDSPLLIWVYGFATNDVFAVGEDGVVLHFDGGSWSAMVSGTELDLYGVWGASRDDVWAVGGDIAGGPPVIVHFDGSDWSDTPVPELDRNATALLKVWGTSDSHVFAVGQSGVILQFDGSDWKQVESSTTNDLVSLWGSGADRIVAVGGRTNAAVVAYDGSQWNSLSVSPLAGLNGVFMNSPDEAVVVGLLGTAAALNVETEAISIEDTPTALTLHAVWGDGSGTYYAVGGRSSEIPHLGVALVGRESEAVE